MTKCDCETCTFNREVADLLELVTEPIIRKTLRRKFEELQQEKINAESELSRLNAVIDRKWPNCGQIMYAKGWQMIPAIVEESKEYYNWEIRSTTRKGKTIYSGPARLAERTNSGGMFECTDGVIREVRDRDDRYADRARMTS